MTRVVVDAGVCGFISVIEVTKSAKRKVKVTISSPCGQVMKLGESLAEVDQWELFKRHLECSVYQNASGCKMHLTCPVPVGILKAIEAEAELALPRDVHIRFEPAENKPST